MIYTLEAVLTEPEIARLRDLASRLEFVDGRATNKSHGAKRNLQISHQDPGSAEPGELVRQAIFRNVDVRQFAFPKTLARPTLSKYEVGMEYGAHVDEALFPSQPEPMRSDISCTVFISDPATYEGGELDIEWGTDRHRYKLSAGSAVFYPSTTIHRVLPVTRGERLVAVAWIESQIADAHQRELLRQTGELAARLPSQGDQRVRVLAESLRTNLYRLWSR